MDRFPCLQHHQVSERVKLHDEPIDSVARCLTADGRDGAHWSEALRWLRISPRRQSLRLKRQTKRRGAERKRPGGEPSRLLPRSCPDRAGLTCWVAGGVTCLCNGLIRAMSLPAPRVRSRNGEGEASAAVFWVGHTRYRSTRAPTACARLMFSHHQSNPPRVQQNVTQSCIAHPVGLSWSAPAESRKR